MPYKDKDKKRKYQREHNARVRAEFLKGKACAYCGSKDDLELHHKDPKTKVDHRIWSWSEARRKSELSKCLVLCGSCHDEHHANERKTFTHGLASTYKKGCRCRPCLEAQYRTMHK